MTDDLALGFDISTQSCKCVAVRVDNLSIVAEARIHYDTDLPSFNTVNGAHVAPGDLRDITSPTSMWLAALKACLRQIMARLAEVSAATRVVAVSGSGQQHGTVYWKRPANESHLEATATQGGEDGSNTLGLEGDQADLPVNLDAIEACLAVTESPIWMNTSTADACEELETFLGGPEAVRRITGSRCIPRFSLHHISKLRRQRPELFKQTARVGLVSSFGASVLLGRVAPIDTTDAAGMNAMNIQALQWCGDVVAAAGVPIEMLGSLVRPWEVLGHVADHWTREPYGLPASAAVVAWSGDNPCAVVGMGLVQPQDLLISLGTSDTCIFVAPSSELLGGHGAGSCLFGHVFPHPLLPDASWGMLVYSNGDVARRSVRDKYADGSWDSFAALVEDSGNSPLLLPFTGLYLGADEISPPIPRQPEPLRLEGGRRVAEFSEARAMNCRAVVEARALAIRRHLRLMCPSFFATARQSGGRLLLTGGASRSRGIVQVYADVFGLPVACLSIPDAAAYGAAVRAVHAVGTAERQAEIIEQLRQGSLASSTMCTPSRASMTPSGQAYYNELEAAAGLLEDELLA